jgi:hypothetical protein
MAKYGSIINLKIITTSATAQNWKKKKHLLGGIPVGCFLQGITCNDRK